MRKKGQITTFIFIGIIILTIISVVLYFRQDQVEKLPTETGSREAPPIQIFVEECIQKTAVSGIFFLGQQGGYLIAPENAFITDFYQIGYGFKDNQQTLPSLNEMQDELSRYLSVTLPICTNNFKSFADMGMKVDEGNISVDTKIFTNEISFEVDYPIKITEDSKESSMHNFIAKVPVRLGYDYNMAQQIIEKSINEGIAVTRTLTPGANLNILPAAKDTVVFSIVDQKSIIYNRTFVFMFAYQLDDNLNPVFDEAYNPLFETGTDVGFNISASDPDGDSITYSSNSSLFNPNPETGEVITLAPAPGEYPVVFFARDLNGGIAEQEVIFNIVPLQKSLCFANLNLKGVDCE